MAEETGSREGENDLPSYGMIRIIFMMHLSRVSILIIFSRISQVHNGSHPLVTVDWIDFVHDLLLMFQQGPCDSTISLNSDQLYEQLAPLGGSIGNSRIVLLGENGHGVGEFTKARVKLIQTMGEMFGML